MQHEDQPGRPSQNPLESAIQELRPGDGSDAAESAKGWKVNTQRESKTLREWAGRAGVLKQESDLLPASQEDGSEHRVQYRDEPDRWQKTTHPGTFGIFPYIDHGLDKQTQQFTEVLKLGHATPLQYLERLLLMNHVFGDDISLEAVIETARGISVETSQPDVEGSLPSLDEIDVFMRRMGFKRVRESGPTWWCAEDDVMVIDAHEANFIKTADGHIIPIDVSILHPDGELLEFIKRRTK